MQTIVRVTEKENEERQPLLGGDNEALGMYKRGDTEKTREGGLIVRNKAPGKRSQKGQF